MKPSPLRTGSLPMLNSSKAVLTRRKQYAIMCIVACSCIATVWLFFSIKPQRLKVLKDSKPNVLHTYNQPLYSSRYVSNSLVDVVENAAPIDAQSLTALLPVTSDSLPALHSTLQPLLRPPSKISEIVLICSESVLTDARHIVRRTVSSTDSYRHPELSVRLWIHGMDQSNAALHVAAFHATTDWVLLLDETGLRDVDNRGTEMLVAPVAVQIPFGPTGFILSASNASRIISAETPQAASYLIPPFVMPTVLLRENFESGVHDVWATLGTQISQSRLDMLGGIVMGSIAMTSRWNPVEQDISSLADDCASTLETKENSPQHNSSCLSDKIGGVFAVLLPSLRNLRSFSSVACRLRADGHIVRLLIYLDDLDLEDIADGSSGTLASRECYLDYDTIVPANGPLPSNLDRRESLVSDWMNTWDDLPEVVVTIAENDWITADLGLFLDETDNKASLVRIPEADLPYCYWMGALSIGEWRNWNIPQIDVSIITKDRPHSLARLLSSLSSSRFFGDTLSLRINMEQSADNETMQMVRNLRWSHGGVFVHHRIVHGGLLPAVVESWYPHSDDTYGLLLEDDVELSPLFYAWVKMSILRYRYGEKGNESSRLFGISLYQQKNLELRPEGRRPFDARALFSEHGLSPSTPYLSQIPCSWGAVYFPEHWREFHDYLTLRFSETSMSIGKIVVPDVRSNTWTKSWKKYFIELVYLRGYVMLYPNYQDFVSLSTNHVEVGSHVKVRSKEKKDMFLLPLMKLSEIPSSGLLDLPGGILPGWHGLPVLNLTGSLASLEELVHQGLRRRDDLTNCSSVLSSNYDARNLMCIKEQNFIP